jgi:hypothetical protein
MYGRELSREEIEEIRTGEAIVTIWRVEDVINQADERGITLTKEQAKNVLRRMESKHDCNIGLNWDVMDHWIDIEVEYKGIGGINENK